MEYCIVDMFFDGYLVLIGLLILYKIHLEK